MERHEEVMRYLEELGVVADGHFVFTSGRHGDKYVNKDLAWTDTAVASRLGQISAVLAADWGVETIVSPAGGAYALAQWTAHHLRTTTDVAVQPVYADKINEDEHGPHFRVRRGFPKLIAGTRCLIVEDVLTTGITTRRVGEAAVGAGAEVVGVIGAFNRGSFTAERLGVTRYDCLVQLDFPSWSEYECGRTGPCSRNVPINTELGHGRAFLERKGRLF